MMSNDKGEFHEAVSLLLDLVRQPSLTPTDEGCQELIAQRLRALGFDVESMPFGDVSNLWARYGTAAPLLCFAGHTDVVPVGNIEDWKSDPFIPHLVDGSVYGRGTADMKGGLAAMVIAAERYIRENPDFKGSIAFLITSDEEGIARNGTRKVIETLQNRSETIDWCIIGEPSSSKRPGDVIRIGRRGSLDGTLIVEGVQGHAAYPELADNPIHRLAKVLAKMQDIEWDTGNEHFPPTTFQSVAIESGVGATNVIPGQASTSFNFRYSTEWDYQSLRKKVETIVSEHANCFEIKWHLSGEPFLTKKGKLIDATCAAITEQMGLPPELSTGGGTSDGRYIAPSGAEVVELGLLNKTAHKANECVAIKHVEQLCDLYFAVAEKLLSN